MLKNGNHFSVQARGLPPFLGSCLQATHTTANANWQPSWPRPKRYGRAATELKSTVKAPRKTAVWKSILRVKHDETPRSRALGVLSNVFLHLHPSKINRDAVAYNYTWGMGGMTFYVYITLVFTGTLLM